METTAGITEKGMDCWHCYGILPSRLEGSYCISALPTCKGTRPIQEGGDGWQEPRTTAVRNALQIYA
jgi:hypothetical protein